MFKCKISRPKKKAQGNLSSYSGLFYENIHAYEEMKILRASPIKVTGGTTSTPRNEDVEAGQRMENIYPITSSIYAKGDGLVNETTSKVRRDTGALRHYNGRWS
ncbi:Hypothetical predicted protein [Paramuricea clavata]|uniref:Uncharacterized protein n=1 Tax=Paramuricea clavata TaxID=317549 RepID=A0A7D9E184_PARCT|nr:Hypothetical predicted protein [Paramuricea clavata]